jgi:hypothetical protein
MGVSTIGGFMKPPWNIPLGSALTVERWVGFGKQKLDEGEINVMEDLGKKIGINVIRMPGWKPSMITELINKLLAHYESTWTINDAAMEMISHTMTNPGLTKYWLYLINPQPNQVVTLGDVIETYSGHLNANGKEFIEWWDGCKEINYEGNRKYAAEDEVFLR